MLVYVERAADLEILAKRSGSAGDRNASPVGAETHHVIHSGVIACSDNVIYRLNVFDIASKRAVLKLKGEPLAAIRFHANIFRRIAKKFFHFLGYVSELAERHSQAPRI